MNEIISKQCNFIVLSIGGIIGGGIMLLIKSSLEWHKSIVTFQTAGADIFFKYFTYLGDGVFAVIVSLLMLLKSFRAFFLVLSSYLFSGLIVQILKRFVFDHMHRPAHVFSELGLTLHHIEGVVLRSHHAFPSGHTTTAFALFMSLSLIFAYGRPLRQILFFSAAFLVAISRVYLNQHFFIDIYFGAIIGIISTIFMFILFRGVNNKWISQPAIKLYRK